MTRLALIRSLLCALICLGCSSAHQPDAPTAVDPALAPETLVAKSLNLHENILSSTRAAFAQDVQDSLIDQGRLWEIRRADRLIGTLQIATVKPDVDLGRRAVRDAFTSAILVGQVSDIRLAGQEVQSAGGSDGVTVMIWFGQGLFEVLQLKDSLVTAPQVAQQLIQHQRTVSSWKPLPQLFTGQS